MGDFAIFCAAGIANLVRLRPLCNKHKINGNQDMHHFVKVTLLRGRQ